MLLKKDAAACEQALRHILYGEDTPFGPRTDWDRIGKIVSRHRMESLAECAGDPALSALSRPERAFGHMLYRSTLRRTMQAVLDEAARRGIRMAVIKGAVLEACYPPDAVRNSGDIDLFVPGDRREAVSAMMADLGLSLVSDIYDDQEGVDVFHTPGGMELEVHYIIFRFFSARQRRILRKRGYFSESCLTPFSDGRLRCETLAPEAHLTYLLYHAAKHMTHHDLSYRMLADLTLFVNRYADSIDREDFRALIRELRFTRPVNALLCYCARHLGMRADFWRQTGWSMAPEVRMSLTSVKPYSLGRYQRAVYEPFYLSECVRGEDGYHTLHTYSPAKALEKKYVFFSFLFWRIIRAVWGLEIDKSNTAI